MRIGDAISRDGVPRPVTTITVRSEQLPCKINWLFSPHCNDNFFSAPARWFRRGEQTTQARSNRYRGSISFSAPVPRALSVPQLPLPLQGWGKQEEKDRGTHKRRRQGRRACDSAAQAHLFSQVGHMYTRGLVTGFQYGSRTVLGWFSQSPVYQVSHEWHK